MKGTFEEIAGFFLLLFILLMCFGLILLIWDNSSEYVFQLGLTSGLIAFVFGILSKGFDEY